MPGSPTARGPPDTRYNAPGDLAFRLRDGVGTPNYRDFAAQ